MSKLRGKKQAKRLEERRSTAPSGPAHNPPGSQNPHKGRSDIMRTSKMSAKNRSKAATR